jgi:lysophospholipase L1-like esterase
MDVKKCLVLLCLSLGTIGFAQEVRELKWYDLSQEKLEGRTSEVTTNPFQRFPDSMKVKTRDAVWNLSRNPAGVNFRFYSSAKNISIKYEVEGEQEFPHMPATGVSGIDLYKKNKNGNWQWVKGNFHFSDTISYTFKVSGLKGNGLNEYMLYFPLYASLKWMKLGINKAEKFETGKPKKHAPIVAYGTSITQGACASRPGNAWTNKLSRSIDTPVLNFGFSGNGRLEPEIIDYISHLKAKVYILDCLANFTSGQELNDSTAYKRLITSVNTLRKDNPETPIILTDHAGYPGGEVYATKKELYENLNIANRKAFKDLKGLGITGIYLLSYKQLNLTAEDFVDGVHPTDGGMEKYSKAYERVLDSIESL